MRFLPRLFITGFLAVAAFSRFVAAADFYVGTYTKPGGSKGIYHYQFDPESGKVTGGELAAESSNPSFLAAPRGGKFLYAVNENDKGTVSAFSIGPDGRLTLLNQRSAKGSGPCHIFVDQTGRNALVANYNSGTIAVLPILENGNLGEASASERFTGSGANPARQGEPHAHSMYVDAAGRYAYACDLGTDWIHGYRFDSEKGTITHDEKASVRVPPGSGPRHLAFHPQKDFVYAIDEINSTINAYSRNPADGSFEFLQTLSTLPADFRGNNSTAEIVIHPGGKFLYGSNRGHNSVAIFPIMSNGQLAAVSHVPTGGKTPRNIALDPSGRWLFAANQDSDDIFIFSVNQETGALTPTGQRVAISSPVCVLFPEQGVK